MFFFIAVNARMAGSLIVIALLTLLLGWLFYVLYGLKVNYDDARKTGLPLIVLPLIVPTHCG